MIVLASIPLTSCLGLAVLITMITQDSADPYASFYCKAPPYLSIFAAFVAGAGIMAMIFYFRPRPKYDPAAQLDPYTGLDDMDIAEHKHNRTRV